MRVLANSVPHSVSVGRARPNAVTSAYAVADRRADDHADITSDAAPDVRAVSEPNTAAELAPNAITYAKSDDCGANSVAYADADSYSYCDCRPTHRVG